MSTIIERSHVEEYVEYRLAFEWNDCPGAGYGFPCDERGSIIGLDGIGPNGMSEAAIDNLHMCFTDDRLVYVGVETYEHSYRVPARLRCDCGREVHLAHFTNTCDCGADYNSGGQRLAPRSQWGEETGESVGDILRIR